VAFVYALKAPESKRQYPRRFKIFLVYRASRKFRRASPAVLFEGYRKPSMG
jgi:hypothetical protein